MQPMQPHHFFDFETPNPPNYDHSHCPMLIEANSLSHLDDKTDKTDLRVGGVKTDKEDKMGQKQTKATSKIKTRQPQKITG